VEWCGEEEELELARRSTVYFGGPVEWALMLAREDQCERQEGCSCSCGGMRRRREEVGEDLVGVSI
jgi:hypothetical protein